MQLLLKLDKNFRSQSSVVDPSTPPWCKGLDAESGVVVLPGVYSLVQMQPSGAAASTRPMEGCVPWVGHVGNICDVPTRPKAAVVGEHQY